MAIAYVDRKPITKPARQHVASDEAIGRHTHVDRSGACCVGGGCSVSPCERQHAEDAFHPKLAIAAVNFGTQSTDLTSSVACSSKELQCRGRRLRRLVSLGRAVATAVLDQVLTQE
jgi:hypothetical protein